MGVFISWSGKGECERILKGKHGGWISQLGAEAGHRVYSALA